MEPRKRQGRPAADEKRDLRADLLATACALLDESGPGALSMREVARRTGCTHQAPYHYFADRETILAALVADGFTELAARLKAANDLADSQGLRTALIASGKAYVGFAAAHPGVFRIMFRPDACNPARFPEVQEVALRSRAELQRLARLVGGQNADTAALETVLWANVHGMASLLVEASLTNGFASPADIDAHLAAVTEIFAEQVLARQAALPLPGARP